MRRSANLEMLFTEEPFERRFQKAKDAGFDAVEFAGWMNKDVDQVKRAAENARIAVAAFTGDEPYSPIDPETQEAYIDHVSMSIEVAKKLNCKLLVTHSNALGPQGEVLRDYRELRDEQKLLCMYDTYRKLTPMLEQSGVTILVEAISGTEHPGVFMDHVDTAAAIVRQIASPNIRLLCDIYHMQANGGRLADSLRRYRDIIGHIHFADVPGRHEPGTGEIHFPALRRCLEEIGYRGIVGFALVPSVSSERAVQAIMNA